MPDALAHLATLLRDHPGPLALERCLPAIPAAEPDRALRTSAALASTLVPGLELAREGVLSVDQTRPFNRICFIAGKV